jgi:DNA-binding transcriptional ArsR family regulator
VSKHIKVLEHAGLIARGQDAQWRPSRLDGTAFRNIAGWLDEYRHFWEQRFDRLEQYLEMLKTKEHDNDRSA